MRIFQAPKINENMRKMPNFAGKTFFFFFQILWCGGGEVELA